VVSHRRSIPTAAWIFLASRLWVSAVALATLVLLESSSNPERFRWDSARLHELGSAVDVWARWDSDWYLRIAEDGYSWPSSTPAFFPLYPLLTAGLGRALAGHFVLAGVLVALAAGLAAFVALFRLCELRLGHDGAIWSVAFLAAAPTTLFLGAVYSESLYLALAIAAFLCAEQGRFGRAGVAAGLAILAKPLGVALIPALVLFAWRSPDRRRTLARLTPAALLPLLYPLALWGWIGRPLAFVDAQEVVWGRRASPAGPLGGIAAVATDVRLLDTLVLLVLVAGGIAAWRLLGAPYGAYVLACVAILLTLAPDRDPLLSVQRFALAAFPVFIVLGAWLSQRQARAVVLLGFAAWSSVLVVRWALWYWVA
jgi:Mannosyltransferase (PIG-V)